MAVAVRCEGPPQSAVWCVDAHISAVRHLASVALAHTQVRPLNSRERDEGFRSCLSFDEDTKQVVLSVSLPAESPRPRAGGAGEGLYSTGAQPAPVVKWEPAPMV